MAGLVMPWLLSLKIFLCLYAPPSPSPFPPFPRPEMVVAVVVDVEVEVEGGFEICLTDFPALSLALVLAANERADKKRTSTGTKTFFT